MRGDPKNIADDAVCTIMEQILSELMKVGNPKHENQGFNTTLEGA